MRLTLTLFLCAWLAAACSPVELSRAEEVRVVLSGPAESSARLMTSQSFVFTTDEQGGTGIDPGDFDEVWHTLPLDTIIDLGVARRLLLRVTATEPAGTSVRMQVWLDGRLQLDGSGAVPPATLQYVFQGS